MNGVSSDLYAYDGDHVELSVCHDHKCGFDHQSECKHTDPADRTPDTTQVSYIGFGKCFVYIGIITPFSAMGESVRLWVW